MGGSHFSFFIFEIRAGYLAGWLFRWLAGFLAGLAGWLAGRWLMMSVGARFCWLILMREKITKENVFPFEAEENHKAFLLFICSSCNLV